MCVGWEGLDLVKAVRERCGKGEVWEDSGRSKRWLSRILQRLWHPFDEGVVN